MVRIGIVTNMVRLFVQGGQLVPVFREMSCERQSVVSIGSVL
jgi:hypothetical protein